MKRYSFHRKVAKIAEFSQSFFLKNEALSSPFREELSVERIKIKASRAVRYGTINQKDALYLKAQQTP